MASWQDLGRETGMKGFSHGTDVLLMYTDLAIVGHHRVWPLSLIDNDFSATFFVILTLINNLSFFVNL